WRREFDLYRRIGLDTLIIIRAGYANKCIFPAQSLPDLLPVREDLGELFYSLADEYELRLFFGTYDSGFHWWRRSWWKEVEVNRPFLDEAYARYGHHHSFAGWYLSHETGRHDAHIVELFREIGGHCKSLADLPVLISPYPQGAKQLGENALTLDESFDHWGRIFEEAHGAFDICAFQDGQVHYQELPRFIQGIGELGQKHGVEIWSNLESFDRDMPIKFPPPTGGTYDSRWRARPRLRRRLSPSSSPTSSPPSRATRPPTICSSATPNRSSPTPPPSLSG
ncbi:MAG: hypothetical protein C4320_08685, partial [Armatimonadota bacterium]